MLAENSLTRAPSRAPHSPNAPVAMVPSLSRLHGSSLYHLRLGRGRYDRHGRAQPFEERRRSAYVPAIPNLMRGIATSIGMPGTRPRMTKGEGGEWQRPAQEV